jgi:hypothetical protein
MATDTSPDPRDDRQHVGRSRLSVSSGVLSWNHPRTDVLPLETRVVLPLGRGTWAEGRWFVGYALHNAREDDSVPDARVCDHACGHGGFCDLRTGFGPSLLGRSPVGWVGLGQSPVGRLGLSFGSPLPAIAVLWRAIPSSSASRRQLEGAVAA